MNPVNMLIGNYGQTRDKPVAPSGDIFGRMNDMYSSPMFAQGQGETAAKDALSRMKGNLAGYTAPEAKKMFGQGMQRIAEGQGQALNATKFGMAKAGIGGGMAGEAAKRIGEKASEQIGEMGTKLTLDNYKQKLSNLAAYAKQAGDVDAMEWAKKAFAGQLSIAEMQALMDKYSAEMGAYAAERGSEHGGLLEAYINHKTGGLGGNVYANLMRG